MSDQPSQDVNTEAIEVLGSGIAAATAYDRPDLADRLRRTHHRLLKPDVQVVVIGEFKQGKSSLINALLNSKVCPVNDDIATAVPTSIRFGPERAAWVLSADPNDDKEEVQRTRIEFGEIAQFAVERAADDSSEVRGVDVELSRRILESGLVLVDTPGVGGLGSAHATAALGALSVADAAIFLSDASQEYTQTEMNFLEQALDMCPHVVCVMTKTDFYPSWRTVKELNEGHLQRAGHRLEILPVSSRLRIEAIRRDDKDLNEESGFPKLISLLNRDIVGGAAERSRAGAAGELFGVVDQLIGQFEAEQAALTDPEARAELMARLEEAKSRADRLRGQAARWSTTLNDGVGDLTSNVDFDFRRRMRAVAAEADTAIEKSDPLETWPEFEPWLVERMSFEVVGNYRFLIDSSIELSRTVAEHFELDSGEVLEQLDVQNPTAALSRVATDTSLVVDDSSVQAKGLTVLRGSYSGMLMFTMLGSLVGVALGPIAIGIGLAMGRKGLKDEKKRQIAQRRVQARNLVRRYSDEVTFQVNKDSRDTLRRTQRKIRDFYAERAEELHRSTTAALNAANKAAQTDEAQRSTRLRNVRAELGRLQTLRERVAGLGATTAGGR